MGFPGESKKVGEQMACGLPLPRLSRHPFHGSPEWKPSGIPVAVVCDHGAVVSTSFPSPDAGRGPAAPATYALDRKPPAALIWYGTLSHSGGIHSQP